MATGIFESTVTEKGQVTIPVEIRRQLGIEPKDRVAFVVENGVVVLKRQESKIARGYGAVKPHQRPEDFRALREAFEQAVGDAARDRLRE